MDDSSSSSSSGSSDSSSSSGNDTFSTTDTSSQDTSVKTERDEPVVSDSSSVSTDDPAADGAEKQRSYHSATQAGHKDAGTALQPSSPGLIILQWLTYAFWGWTLLAFVWLVFIVIASVMSPINTSGMVPYAVAASLVLLPIAILCDIFYSRKEPLKKHGAAMVVMVIHAVIFALFGIGILITGVFTLVNLAINDSSDTSSAMAWVLTALLSAVVYLLAFLRTLNPFKSGLVGKWFWVLMAVLVSGFMIGSFIGPVGQARLAREDDEIADNLESINNAIRGQATRTGELPASLTDISLTPQEDSLIARGVISYVAEGEATAEDRIADDTGSPQFRYQLCATFQRQSEYYSGSSDEVRRGEYSPYLSAQSHPAGKTCHKLLADKQ